MKAKIAAPVDEKAKIAAPVDEKASTSLLVGGVVIAAVAVATCVFYRYRK